MPKKRKALGKGLEALLPGSSARAIEEVPLDSIQPNPYQPRKDFDEASLDELVASIRTHGVVQPLILRSSEDGTYQLVAGERRWRAARKAGLDTVPALIRPVEESQMLEVALIENLQREDLNPVEEARAYRVLLEEFGLTQEQLAGRVSKSRSQVANTIRLLHLESGPLSLLQKGSLSVGHAKVLLGVADPVRQTTLAQRTVDEGLTVRALEDLARDSVSSPGTGPAGGARGTGGTRRKDPDLGDLEHRIATLLGTRVNIRQGKQKGRLEIEFFGTEDLNRILEILNLLD